MNRRFFLKLSALFSGLSLISSRLAGYSLPRETGFQTEAIYHFKIGNFKCICIKDAVRGYPLENFFKNVPKETVQGVLSRCGLPTDQVFTPFTHLVVSTGKNKVLVDTGLGGDLAEFIKIAGVDPTEIDSVFITHAHPDHVGGLLDKANRPIYTNAQYYIWRGEWEFWFSAEAEKTAKESHIKTAREKLRPLSDRVIFIEKEEEVLPGIHILQASGHTPGHMVVFFTSNSEKLYYTGDTVLYPLHLEHPDWLPVYDIITEKAAASKKKIFDRIADENVLMVGQQFVPFPSLGRVVKKEIGWKFEPVNNS